MKRLVTILMMLGFLSGGLIGAQPALADNGHRHYYKHKHHKHHEQRYIRYYGRPYHYYYPTRYYYAPSTRYFYAPPRPVYVEPVVAYPVYSAPSPWSLFNLNIRI